MQDGDYADDSLLETYLQLLAVDRSKVSVTWLVCASLQTNRGNNNSMAVTGMIAMHKCS